MSERRELLTHSRQAAFKECRRKHYYSYELGMRRTDDARALRMGSAFHDGIEQLASKWVDDSDAHAAMAEVMADPLADACAAVRKRYENMPQYIDAYEWAIECETIMRLVCAYQWRWKDSKIENIETEFKFQLPLVNPDTGKSTPSFDLAGKIDGIVRLEDGRLAVKETKTVGEELGPQSPIWRRLRMDHQISLYIDAARRMGFKVDTVLYDVIRKPSIAPEKIPVTDIDGMKIVLDASGDRVRNAKGKEWRQTGDKEKGYYVQTRPMSVEEWGEKLTADIVSRPEFYFARVEIPRLDADVLEYQHELWDIQLEIREAQRTGRHYRTVSRNTCQYCSYFEPCSTSQQIDQANLPMGFEILSDPHPELINVSITTKTTTASAAAEGSIDERAAAHVG